MMDWQTVEEQCFKDNKFFSQLVGVWPDQERVTKFVTRLVILVLVIIALITEVCFFLFRNVADRISFVVFVHKNFSSVDRNYKCENVIKVDSPYITGITDNTILQRGRAIGSDTVPGHRYRYFNQAV